MTDPLSAEKVAALVAPVVDRLRLAIHGATRSWSTSLARENGLDQSMSTVLGNLRNVAPGRMVARASILAIFIYQDSSPIERGIDGLIDAGLLIDAGDAQVSLTSRGVELTEKIRKRSDDTATELWSGHENRIAWLADLASRALGAATADGGAAFHVMAPVTEHAQATAAALLAERLTGLRFHRFDAHIAAWRSAGLSADQIKHLALGPERSAIELDTNRRAATPYEVLDPTERLDLLAGLGALPG